MPGTNGTVEFHKSFYSNVTEGILTVPPTFLGAVQRCHPLFAQVFDKGYMEDGEGRFIDFKNTLILLTTNAGTDLIANLCKDPELMPIPKACQKPCAPPC